MQPVKVAVNESGRPSSFGETSGRIHGSSAGSTGSDGPLRPPRGQMRSARGSFQQRLFPSSRSRLTAESPPSDSVGFFFGTTPDNQRWTRCFYCIIYTDFDTRIFFSVNLHGGMMNVYQYTHFFCK